MLIRHVSFLALSLSMQAAVGQCSLVVSRKLVGGCACAYGPIPVNESVSQEFYFGVRICDINALKSLQSHRGHMKWAQRLAPAERL